MLGGMFVGWSSCQADYFSSEEEEENSLGDIEAFNEDDFILSSDSEEEQLDTGKTKLTKREALNILKDSNGDIGKATETIMKTMIEDNSEEMSSQAEEKKKTMVKRVYDKFRKLSKDEKAQRFRYKQEALDDTFEHASQSSLVELIKSEKRENRAEKEDTGEEINQKKFRKSLHKCTIETAKCNTEHLLETVKQEAQELMTSPTALLAFLLYRLNYVHRRNFAMKMLKVFKEDEWTEEKVGVEEALALLERRRLGKGGYRYVANTVFFRGVKIKKIKIALVQGTP